ncbi:MAG: methyl-accepting chemotaxis protein [Planctomycetota bacterium]|nr:methyl-accepting chemotaxis protein [Planctomycetota bacterium]
MSIRDLGINRRFLLMGGIVVVGFVALLLIAGGILDHVMINGDLYTEIVQEHDLVADILPPPHYVVDPFLLCHQILATRMTASRNEMIERLDAAAELFEKRRAYWQSVLPDGDLKADMALVAEPAIEFFRIVKEQFVPAVRGAEEGDVEARRILELELAPVFERHKGAVDNALVRARAVIAATESDAADAVATGRATALAVVGILLLVILAGGALILRPVGRSLGELSERMRELAEAEGDLSARIEVTSRDEVGQLASSFNQFVEKIGGLVQAVRKSSIQLTSTSTEMAATSREQEATVNAFGSSTNQIAASVQQISATGTELMRTIDDVQEIAHHSASLADTGRDRLETMESTMSQLTDSSSSISDKLSIINEKAGDITSVVTTITKVADQTNLLSVNAAIEAEKAGEYGRGFLVVAQEIRRLADQTASATLDIEQTVQEMQTSVSAGVMEMDKFADHVRRSVRVVGEVGTQLGSIIAEVERLTRRFDSVGEGMKSQATGADQINDAMRSLNDTVQQTVTSLREVTSVAEDLRSAANTLNDEMGKFHLGEV